MSIAIGVVVSPRAWPDALRAHTLEHLEPVRLRRVSGLGDALRPPVDVLIVDDGTAFVSEAAVSACERAGVAVVGLFEADSSDLEGHGRAYLDSLGAMLTLPASVPPSALLEAARAWAGGRSR